MPTYEYRCESCGTTVEVVQGFSDAPLTTCERCSGVLHKVYAPVGIVFKGSGFYKNDSRSSAKSSSRPSSESSSDGGADKKGADVKKEPTTTPAPAAAASEAKAPKAQGSASGD